MAISISEGTIKQTCGKLHQDFVSFNASKLWGLGQGKPAVKHARTHEHKEILHSYNKSWLLASLGLIQEQQVICSPGSLSYCLPVLPMGPGFPCRELAPVGNDS